jgi:hypothetical protein
VDFTQHEGLPERFVQCDYEPPDRGGVALSQQLSFRRFLGFAPQRRLLGVIRQLVGGGWRTRAAREFGMTDIAQDCEQPRLDRRSAIAVEMLQGAQIAFLNGVLGIVGVAKQVARQRIGIVKIRQRGVAKTLRLSGSWSDPGLLFENLTGITCGPALAENADARPA